MDMQRLATTLSHLERLKALVDEYRQTESRERSRELAGQIPEAYGAVEEVYQRYAGDRRVDVMDMGHKKTFSSFFEAGWLSGRTFHRSEGYKELIKVIGRVRADVEDQTRPPAGTDPIEGAWRLLHPDVQSIAGERFRGGHYADAVEATFKELVVTVRALVLQRGGQELDGVPLMQKAFSPNNPLIVLADLSTQSGRDMQRGYMDLFAGAVSAIRNPKAYENIVISRERAVHLLFIASTLWYTLNDRP